MNILKCKNHYYQTVLRYFHLINCYDYDNWMLKLTKNHRIVNKRIYIFVYYYEYNLHEVTSEPQGHKKS